jgi:hypothetical protein
MASLARAEMAKQPFYSFVSYRRRWEVAFRVRGTRLAAACEDTRLRCAVISRVLALAVGLQLV